jgi:hypothetical protein
MSKLVQLHVDRSEILISDGLNGGNDWNKASRTAIEHNEVLATYHDR